MSSVRSVKWKIAQETFNRIHTYMGRYNDDDPVYNSCIVSLIMEKMFEFVFANMTKDETKGCEITPICRKDKGPDLLVVLDLTITRKWKNGTTLKRAFNRTLTTDPKRVVELVKFESEHFDRVVKWVYKLLLRAINTHTVDDDVHALHTSSNELLPLVVEPTPSRLNTIVASTRDSFIDWLVMYNVKSDRIFTGWSAGIYDREDYDNYCGVDGMYVYKETKVLLELVCSILTSKEHWLTLRDAYPVFKEEEVEKQQPSKNDGEEDYIEDEYTHYDDGDDWGYHYLGGVDFIINSKIEIGSTHVEKIYTGVLNTDKGQREVNVDVIIQTVLDVKKKAKEEVGS